MENVEIKPILIIELFWQIGFKKKILIFLKDCIPNIEKNVWLKKFF